MKLFHTAICSRGLAIYCHVRAKNAIEAYRKQLRSLIHSRPECDFGLTGDKFLNGKKSLPKHYFKISQFKKTLYATKN